MIAHSRERGYTLVEVLVVLAAFSLIITALFVMFDWHAKTYGYQEAFVNTWGSSRQSLDEFRTYGSQAYRVVASQTINGTAYTSDSDTIVLQLPAVDSSGSVIANAWDYVVFDRSGNTLAMVIDGNDSSFRKDRARQLSTVVQSLTITYPAPGFSDVQQFTVDLQLQASGGKQTVTAQEQQTVILRNY